MLHLFFIWKTELTELRKTNGNVNKLREWITRQTANTYSFRSDNCTSQNALGAERGHSDTYSYQRRLRLADNQAPDTLTAFLNEPKTEVKCREFHLMYAGDGTNAAARNNIAVGDEAPLECCGGLNNVDYSKVKKTKKKKR